MEPLHPDDRQAVGVVAARFAFDHPGHEVQQRTTGEVVPGGILLFEAALVTAQLHHLGLFRAREPSAMPSSMWPEASTGAPTRSTPQKIVRHLRQGQITPWLHAVLDWDWVSDLQRALNERGAELAVDGAYGRRTAGAVEELQHALGLDGGNGWIGPESIDALELDAPDSARITLLLGGSQGTC